ncbi:hypothetical protein, partial [Parabacteroides goldsteinii]|uniref:hypothetical protein n=1 Tax=Parabacteroides goldsteinii TaxID=328812 RepID=UPI0025A2AF12
CSLLSVERETIFRNDIRLLVILDQVKILDSTHRQRLTFDVFFLWYKYYQATLSDIYYER